MGLMNRAFKSIWRRKWRTGVALIAIAIAMAIMIAIPAGLDANQSAAVSARDNIQASITSMNNEIQNMSLVVEASYGAAGRTPGSLNFNRARLLEPRGINHFYVLDHRCIEHQFAGGRGEHRRIYAKDRGHAEHERFPTRKLHARQRRIPQERGQFRQRLQGLGHSDQRHHRRHHAVHHQREGHEPQ